MGIFGLLSPSRAVALGYSWVLSLDVIMLVMNDSGMKRLLATSSRSAGSQCRGRSGQTKTSANTDVLLRADLPGHYCACCRLLSLEGATLRPDAGENRKLYGRDISNKEIIETARPSAYAGIDSVLLNGILLDRPPALR